MANAEHLRLIKQGIETWNQWRKKKTKVKPDLFGADLRRVNLSGVNLSKANLRRANLSGTNLSRADLQQTNLSKANLNKANLNKANLNKTDLSEANLNKTDLSEANLSGANLSRATVSGINLLGLNLNEANLSGADLRKLDLSGVNLSRVVLCGADLTALNLSGANLSSTDLSGADLSGADLRTTQVLGTKFEQTILTGACLQDWNTNSSTNFEGAICEYVYLKANQKERRPREGNFKPGEFATLFQQAIDTVDLIFKDGIDWQAFVHSFKDLRRQYAGQDLSIQAIEKKRGSAFVVRLEVPEHSDQTAVEEDAKILYRGQLQQIEEQYQQLFQLQGWQIKDYRSLVHEHQQQNSRLMRIVETMADKESVSKYDLRGARFNGGFAENVEGDQISKEVTNHQIFNGPVGNSAVNNYGNMSAIQNNYGSNAEEITRLLSQLREKSQSFPNEQKDDALDLLDDLEGDLSKAEPDQGRIGRRLKKLIEIAATLTIGSAAFSADLAQLATNLNIPLP